VPKKSRGTLLHYFIQKKSAAETHRILVETYHALSETTCRDWFRRSKNNDFDVEDKEHSSTSKKLKDEELKALLHEDLYQTLTELAESLGVDHTKVSKCLKVLGMIQKQLDAVRVEAERHRTASFHVRTAASTAEKERLFAFYRDRR